MRRHEPRVSLPVRLPEETKRRLAETEERLSRLSCPHGFIERRQCLVCCQDFHGPWEADLIRPPRWLSRCPWDGDDERHYDEGFEGDLEDSVLEHTWPDDWVGPKAWVECAGDCEPKGKRHWHWWDDPGLVPHRFQGPYGERNLCSIYCQKPADDPIHALKEQA